MKTWGASNAENEANYGGVSGFNLKKPSMQQDLGWLGWVGLGWVGLGWLVGGGSRVILPGEISS